MLPDVYVGSQYSFLRAEEKKKEGGLVCKLRKPRVFYNVPTSVPIVAQARPRSEATALPPELPPGHCLG